MSHMPDNEQRNREILEMRKTGLCPSSIAKALGITSGVVSGVLNRAKVRGLTGFDDQEKEEAVALLDVEGHDAASRRYGVSIGTIYWWKRQLQYRRMCHSSAEAE